MPGRPQALGHLIARQLQALARQLALGRPVVAQRDDELVRAEAPIKGTSARPMTSAPIRFTRDGCARVTELPEEGLRELGRIEGRDYALERAAKRRRRR